MARSRWKKQHGKLTLRSGFEVKTAKYLEENGVDYTYEEDVIEYTVPESKHKYKPDFRLPNGIFLECKGRFTAADRKKMSLAIEQNPDLDIRMLFMTNNTLNRSSRTTYTDWCDKRGIKCHVSSKGEIPKEWHAEQKGQTTNDRQARTKARKRNR